MEEPITRLACVVGARAVAPHGIAVDSHGDIYVGEVSNTAWPQMYEPLSPKRELRSLQKLRKVR